MTVVVDIMIGGFYINVYCELWWPSVDTRTKTTAAAAAAEAAGRLDYSDTGSGRCGKGMDEDSSDGTDARCAG